MKVDPKGDQSVTARAYNGRINWHDKGVGHMWIIIDFGDHRLNSLELQPHGSLFGGGRMDDIDYDQHDTVHRAFDFQRTYPFDAKRFPNKDAITKGIKNRDWSWLNNCVDFSLDVIDRLTGYNYNGSGLITPGEMKDRMRPMNDREAASHSRYYKL